MKKNEHCHISLRPMDGEQTHPGYRDADFKRLFGTLDVEPRLPFTRAQFFQEGRKYAKGQSISGVQEKLPLAIRNGQLVPVDEGGRYILKPSPEAFPHAAENEHAGMEFSRLAGTDTALCGLFPFADGGLAYVCRRFDRDADGTKYPQEDLLQCAGLPTEDKYTLSYEQAGRIISQATNGKLAPVLDMIVRVMLAYVMGNNDLHLKNLSLRKNPKNRTHFYDFLSPNYDVLFCDSIDAADDGEFLALDLLAEDEYTPSYEHYGFYTGIDFIELGRRLGVPERAVKNRIARMAALQPALLSLIKRSFMPESMKSAASKTVQERLRALSIVETE